MAWDGYITNLLAYQDVNNACIASKDGVIWAKSTNFPGTAEQLVTLSSAITNESATGITLGDTKYMILNRSDGNLQARKEKHALSVSSSTTAIVVTMYVFTSPPDPTPGLNQRLAKASMTVADYLTSAGC